MAYALKALSIKITIGAIILIIYFILAAALILGAFTIISVTFLFFTEGTFSPLSAVVSLQEFAKYPLTIFNRYIKAIFTWIMPLGFVSFYPASYFFKNYQTGFPVLLVSFFIVVSFFCLAVLFFNYGIRKYQSTGG